MRILFATYSLAFQNPGGGEQVMQSLKKELTQAGATVDLFNPWHSDPANYDVIHYFSCLETSFWPFVKGKYPDIPFLVTPTLWQDAGLRSWLGLAKQLSLGRMPDSRLARFELPDYWLPTTGTEAERLAVFWRIKPARLTVLPNGVDAIFSKGDPRIFRAHFKVPQRFVLHVGRFHPVKNQLTLIRALKQAQLRGVFIGSPDIGNAAYHAECLSEGQDHCLFIPALAHEDPLLAAAYAAADVFALPSQFETFGIAALEAAVAGAPLVLTSNIWSRNVFEGVARFVTPGSVGELVAALVDSAGKRESLHSSGTAQRLLAEYEWSSIGQRLLQFYERIT